MALDDLLITTGVDQLIKLLSERGRLEIGAAAKELRQPIRTIEDWSHVLEEEGLVKVEYKLTKIYLVWQKPSREYLSQKEEKLSQKAAQAGQDLEKLFSKVEKGGQDLAGMQSELNKLQSLPSFSPQEAERLKEELAQLSAAYDSAFESARQKMAALEKRLASAKPKVEGGSKDGGAGADFTRELATLSKFESTVQSQIEENETFFEAFEARLEEFKKRVEEGKPDEKIEELKAELASVRALKEELAGALEAVAEEQASISGKVEAVEKKLSSLSEREDSLAGAKKRLVEIRRLSEDAKKQRKNISGQLSDTLSIIRKQVARIKEAAQRQESMGKSMQELKDEYVDVSEEISTAGEQLSSRQKELSGRIAAQISALERAGKGRLSRDEVQKVAALLSELRRQQAEMEASLRSLSRQTQVLKVEAQGAAGQYKAEGKVQLPQIAQVMAPAGAGAPGAGSGGDVSLEFVEKVKLTEEEEGEFERKRAELRELIRKMWEESKGGS